jgi:hypothetical protein
MEETPTRNRDAGIGLLRRAPFPPARAWRVAAPMWVAVAPEIDGVVRQLPDQAGRRTQ